MSAAVLQATELHTYYGKSHILHGVSLELRRARSSRCWAATGRKTTTLRSLVGLTPARSGSVSIFGQTVNGLPPFAIAGKGVGYVPEGRRVFGNLTVEENLKVPMERPGPWTISKVYELFPRRCSGAPIRAGNCRAASRRCWPSAAR